MSQTQPARSTGPVDHGHGVHDPRVDTLVSQRPWGQFQQLIHNQSATVKIITVEPGHRLSLQKHAQRGEFWQLLDEPLDVTVDGDTWQAQQGEQVWIPIGSEHRLGNSGERPGRVLEIAFGHFDEDDIERLEDDYTR